MKVCSHKFAHNGRSHSKVTVKSLHRETPTGTCEADVAFCFGLVLLLKPDDSEYTRISFDIWSWTVWRGSKVVPFHIKFDSQIPHHVDFNQNISPQFKMPQRSFFSSVVTQLGIYNGAKHYSKS